MLAVDCIEKSLSCVCLQFQRTNGKSEVPLAGRELSLFLIGSIKGSVHIVPKDLSKSIVEDNSKQFFQ